MPRKERREPRKERKERREPRKERKEREYQGSESPTVEALDWTMAVGASGWATAESTSMSMVGASGWPAMAAASGWAMEECRTTGASGWPTAGA